MVGIVDKKYRGRKEPDWLRKWIDAQTIVDGTVDYNKLIAIGEANKLKADTIEKFKQDDPKRNGVLGRASMTIRNMLHTKALDAGKVIGFDQDGDLAEFEVDGDWLDTNKARRAEMSEASKARAAEAAAKKAAEAPATEPAAA